MFVIPVIRRGFFVALDGILVCSQVSWIVSLYFHHLIWVLEFTSEESIMKLFIFTACAVWCRVRSDLFALCDF